MTRQHNGFTQGEPRSRHGPPQRHDGALPSCAGKRQGYTRVASGECQVCTKKNAMHAKVTPGVQNHTGFTSDRHQVACGNPLCHGPRFAPCLTLCARRCPETTRHHAQLLTDRHSDGLLVRAIWRDVLKVGRREKLRKHVFEVGARWHTQGHGQPSTGPSAN